MGGRGLSNAHKGVKGRTHPYRIETVLAYATTLVTVMASPWEWIAAAVALGLTVTLVAKRKPRAVDTTAEDRFHALVTAVEHYAICVLDSRGRVVTWNKGAERITGYAASEAIGRPVSMLHAEPEPRGGGLLDRARANGSAEDETFCITKDGAQRFLHWAATALVSRDRVVGFIAILRENHPRVRSAT